MIQITITPENSQQIDICATAMHQLVAVPPVAAPKPKAKAAAPEAKPVTTVTLEQVRAKLSELMQAGRSAEAKQLLVKECGCTKLTEVPPEKYAELLAAAEAL